MNVQCVVYVTDEGYFFPTAVSALQARKEALSSTDIVIVATEVFRNKSNAEEFCRDAKIVLVDGAQFLAEKFAKIDQRDFSGRVSVAAMGRLLLSDVLPSHYQQVIYIDGDTQIIGKISPLEQIHVPAGKILAALDYISIVQRARGNASHRYFNSGVLKFDRSDWIGQDAFDYFVTHGGELHDQGALNAVAGDGLILMSNRWNFPRQFLHLAGTRPSIIHFASHPKPWDGVFFPWSQAETATYRQALRENQSLEPFVRKISTARRCAYKVRSLGDRIACRIPFFELAAYQSELRRVVLDWQCDDALFAPSDAFSSLVPSPVSTMQ
ncbi:glycosyltransferase [Rhizobium sp. CECT 9324]|uniref:glycosyltransferase family 8 protein n=1 Tax=Rhizobium sp. CECT 9324 TaxID=2845820 RepID=UPI001E4F3DB6|nr:glycosyltransferase [Rhizobium sp. CECT 9324]CAH0342912.1 hypothetical protein RHI9324_04644 [Rhizobium sp. CECT 9324]